MAAAKSVAGIGVLEFKTAHNRALAVFLCAMHCYTQIMVGRAGAEQSAPGFSVLTGYANPVRLTTSAIGVSSGEFLQLKTEVAIMASIPTLAQPEITVVSGQAVTSSLALADYFTKRHADVIRKIESLECSPEFNERNFTLVEYTDGKGERRPYYQITRDGFAFLAMGFTGKRAAEFKESYIKAFNSMEAALQQPAITININSTCHNAEVAAEYVANIQEIWCQSLLPLLSAAQSPLVHTLTSRINDATSLTSLVAARLKKQGGIQ